MNTLDELVYIVDHQSEWGEQAKSESARINAILHGTGSTLEHIGSTAITGLASKPIIDLMIGVPKYPSPAIESALVRLGYDALGEAGVTGRAYFRMRGKVNFNVHVVQMASVHWVQNIAFRDYLRRNSSARERYETAKKEAILHGANTLLAYSNAKAEIVNILIQEALSSA